MERRFSVHARAHRKALIAAVVLASSSAIAAPKGKDARVQFDKGVAAYTKGDYAAAAEALGASFVLEADAETLFAWAQTERKLGHCDRAVELYAKLLDMDLPAENKQAVSVQIDECKAIIAEEQAKQAPPPVEPPPAPVQAEPVQPERRTWWKDPVGGALVGGGVVALGLGTVFLVQAKSADSDKGGAATYDEFVALDDRAESRGRLGVISMIAGGALAAAGVVWYVTREPSGTTSVSSFFVPSGGGVAVSGRF